MTLINKKQGINSFEPNLKQKEHTGSFSYCMRIIKESKIFIWFSILSCALPILYCLIASLIKPNGSQAVMAVGYVTPFVLAFLQISLSITMIVFSQLNKLKIEKRISKLKNEDTLMSSAIWMSLVLGIVMLAFYLLSSYLYMYFANDRPNTQDTMLYGFDFINTTVPFILFLPLFTTLLFYINKKNKHVAILFTVLFFSFICCFSIIFVLWAEMKVIGIGLGSSCAILLLLLFEFFYLKIFSEIELHHLSQIKYFNSMISKVIFKESLTSISLSVFKGVAILCLSFTIPLTISDFVPLPYQMSRVIWFNLMYFIPCIGIGIGEVVRYHYLNHNNVFKCNIDHNWKKDFLLIIISLFTTILIAVGCVFMVDPLINLYTKNDFNKFEDGSMPEIKIGETIWGVPSEAPKDFTFIEKLSELKWVQFPEIQEFKPIPPEASKLEEIKINLQNLEILKKNKELINTWLIEMRETNINLIKEIQKNLEEWWVWLQQKNLDGLKLIDFLSNQNKITPEEFNIMFKNFFRILKENSNSNEKFKIAFDLAILNPVLKKWKPSLSYFVYLWLFTKTDSIVTQSFLNLPILISDDNNILQFLYFKAQPFEAKSMIYICVFSICNSVWAILLQTNARNYKRGMPYWLMTLVYFVCIGGLVTFGTLFGVTFKDDLGQNNPFQYLDAWTFPLVIISICAITVVSIRAMRSYKFARKIKNADNIENLDKLITFKNNKIIYLNRNLRKVKINISQLKSIDNSIVDEKSWNKIVQQNKVNIENSEALIKKIRVTLE